MINNALKFDVIIVGSGISGLNLALSLDKNLKIAIFSKKSLNMNSSYLAQGGISVTNSSNEIDIDSHINDTLKAGSYINSKKNVEILVKESYKAIQKLEKFGIDFDKKNNNYSLAKEGGHSANRIVRIKGDSTGKMIVNQLIDNIKNKSNIKTFENNYVISLIKDNNSCIGIKSKSKLNKEISNFYSTTTILATGGIGSCFVNSTNYKDSTGDGIILAQEIGCNISNMHFIQYHPTTLSLKNKIFLISEALRGEGAFLLNSNMNRFMKKYSDDMELTTRDILSRAIDKEIKESPIDHVFLDITNKSKEFLLNRFPTIFNECYNNDIDISKVPIPVKPSQHYLIGGISVDSNNRTSITNLFAIGECSFNNVHGANRLASNSLLECLVFSNKLAQLLNLDYLNNKYDSINLDYNDDTMYFSNTKFNKNKHNIYKKEVIKLIEDNLGLIKNKSNLNIILKKLLNYEMIIQKNQYNEIEYFELKNIIKIGILICKQSIQSKKNIGCNYII